MMHLAIVALFLTLTLAIAATVIVMREPEPSAALIVDGSQSTALLLTRGTLDERPR